MTSPRKKKGVGFFFRGGICRGKRTYSLRSEQKTESVLQKKNSLSLGEAYEEKGNALELVQYFGNVGGDLVETLILTLSTSSTS